MASNETPVATPGKDKATRLRSPAYPGIDLETALKRAEGFYKKERRNSAPYAVAVSHWGFGAKSSGGLVTVAAMRSFGLLTRVERTPGGRPVQLSDLALQILLDERPDSIDRAMAIKRAALKPKIHAAIWQKYGTTESVSHANLKHDLVFRLKFNENTVEEFIKEYKDTIRFAKLTESDKLSLSLEDKEALEDQGEEETEVAETQQYQPPATPLPPPPGPKFNSPLVTGTRQDVFSLIEGPVTIQWPVSLSPESYEDLAAWMDILKRKIGRSVQFKMTKREVVVKLRAGFRIDGDPESEMPCALIDPSQLTFDSQTLVPSEMLRELLEDGVVKPNAGSGRRVFTSA